MQPWDETVFDEMCALLPPEQAADARDYLDHNELALAFETAVDYLSEESVPITAALRRRIAEAAAYSQRVLNSPPYCPDADQPRWHRVEDTMAGLEIEERLPGSGDVAWLAGNRCSPSAVPARLARGADGEGAVSAGNSPCGRRHRGVGRRRDGLDRLERCSA
jgi:hypothetical protein